MGGGLSMWAHESNFSFHVKAESMISTKILLTDQVALLKSFISAGALSYIYYLGKGFPVIDKVFQVVDIIFVP